VGLSLINQNTAVGTTQPRFAGWLSWLFCSYLLLVGAAELLIAQRDPAIGLAIHALLLLTLTLHAGLGHDPDGRKLALALTLAPLLRILSLALPLANLPRLAWYPVVSALLLISALIVIRQLRMSRSELGLRSDNLLIQLMLMGGGLGIGASEYALLGAPQLGVAFSWNALMLLAVMLLIFTGFVEELIFRGLLQSLALPALGRWALVYVSLLFAALQIGYLSASVVAFAFGIGLIFACAARWSGSIVGVALAHSLANVTLFILMPFLAQQAASPIASAIRAAIAIGTMLAGVALAILLGRAIWQWRAALPAPTAGSVKQPLPERVGVAPASIMRGPGATPTLLGQNETLLIGALLTQPAPRSNPAANLAPAVPMIRSTAPGPNMTPAPGPRQSQKLLLNALLARLAPRSNPTAGRAPAVPMIRALRRGAGMTYVELGQRTQLPVRLLAEIEHGLRPPSHDQLDRIFQALGVDLQQQAGGTV
jgi:membrane protease YdiL (CAAX protease family)